MLYMKKTMIELTHRWKTEEMVGVETEYQIFTWSLGFEKMYTRRNLMSKLRIKLNYIY
jgi:hypothetical protein